MSYAKVVGKLHLYNLAKRNGVAMRTISKYRPILGTYATGGTVTYSGGYTIHTFTGNGSLGVSVGGDVEYLVVAGGGSGGARADNNGGGGGGGAGGFRTGTGFAVTAQTYPITVGAGGAAAAPGNNPGNKGSNSIFSTITSTGGGRGGAYSSDDDGTGGSGGGAGRNGGFKTGSAGNEGGFTPSEGNSGGDAGNVSVAAGGGGAGAVGANGGGTGAGAGGAGVASSISGSSVTYAGGGGGGADSIGNRGIGGAGGGGNGGYDGSGGGTAGTANTGSGGGGGTAGAGGSGIVIIRYQYFGAGLSVGDTGPGGGIVFYVGGGKYYEAAPSDWSGGADPGRTWSTGANQSAAVSGADGTAIGTGYQNSVDIVNQAGNVAASCGAVLARNYTGGGFSDWFLPSIDEIVELEAQGAIADFPVPPSLPPYLTSTEVNATTFTSLWDSGTAFNRTKDYNLKVRPIRSGVN